VAQIDQILLGGAIAEAASELAYAEWRLRSAADPRFVTEDGQAAAGGTEGVESGLVGKPAPEVPLDQLEGGKFQLSRMRGKVVVLDFWATWCGWCMRSMPEIAAMIKEFDDRVVLVPVNLQEDAATAAAGLERLGLEKRSALDVDGAMAEHYSVTAIPQTVIVGDDGNVTHVFVGGGPDVVDRLRAAIRQALGEVTDDVDETANADQPSTAREDAPEAAGGESS
jgi:thiol-disulfide isomerase/thioredoxin